MSMFSFPLTACGANRTLTDDSDPSVIVPATLTSFYGYLGDDLSLATATGYHDDAFPLIPCAVGENQVIRPNSN